MNQHGGKFPLAWRKVRTQSTAPVEQRPTAAAAPAAGDRKPGQIPQIPGFRHFLQDPTPEQCFKIYDGLDPLASAENLRKLQRLMGRLAKRMSDEFDWKPLTGSAGNEVWENPGIPSGYTYLLQLIAHDLVYTSVPISIAEDDRTGVLNARRAGLRLDTIYGGGPLVCPFAYELDDKEDQTRTRLRLGQMREDPDNPKMGRPFRDIPRVKAEGASGPDRDIPAGNKVLRALTEPLIPDPRNDAHAILSQLTTLFHHLHNGILGLLPKREDMDHADSEWEAAYERFLCARGAATLIYRNVIRKDLMRRILHPKIYAAYRNADFTLLSAVKQKSGGTPAVELNVELNQETWSIPLEFSHGAFRFGHAMVRDEYQFNQLSTDKMPLDEVIGHTSIGEPQNMPLSKLWIIAWSNFFEINGRKPNLSRRIGPRLGSALARPDRFPAIVQERAGAADDLDDEIEANSVGLAYRDLMSSGLVSPWSVGALIDLIKDIRADFITQSDLLADPQKRADALRQWLTAPDADHPLTDEADIKSLCTHPPLPFFVMFEAAMDPEHNGTRLGVLGSIIVAEIVFGALAHDRLPPEVDATSLKQALAKLTTEIYGKDAKHLAAVPEIETMSELVEFTAQRAGLEKAAPAFV